MLRVLLTNDDGIGAPGLSALARRLAPRCELLIVAPERQSSAMGQSITLHKPLRVRPVPALFHAVPAAKPIEAYECSGTPADCVIVALHYLFADRLPQLVLSGINDGCNVAQDLVYSGTVGGALEGSVNGIPGLAFSLLGHSATDFDQAAEAIDLLVSMLVYGRICSWQAGLAATWTANAEHSPSMLWSWPLPATAAGEPPDGTYPVPGAWMPQLNHSAPCFNVNLPDAPSWQLCGICWTRPGRRKYTDIVKQVYDPRGEPYYWIAGDRVHETLELGTDTHALAQGYLSVSPISYDLGIPGRIEQLASWMLERKS